MPNRSDAERAAPNRGRRAAPAPGGPANAARRTAAEPNGNVRGGAPSAAPARREASALARPGKEIPSTTVIRLRGAVDRPFLIIVILLVFLGTAMVFSASYAYAEYHFNDSLYFIRSQLIWVFLGFVGMVIVMNMDYRFYQKVTMPAFFITFILMILVAVPGIGQVKNGARRWLAIGAFSFQPSEVMKLALIMVLALYISANHGNMHKFRQGIFFPYAIIGSVCFVTILEKHLSATIILLLIGTLIVFIGGAPIKGILYPAGIGAGAVLLAITFFDYARDRLEFWIHPENDPGEAGYQLLQSLYAIGSGGFLGTGIGNSRQKYLYLPESQNDFIFSVIGEELGFVGCLAVIGLFVLLVWRAVRIARRAPDTYSALLVLGIIGQIALQCIMNIAVVTGTIPVTGVSLPFFSYGGSSLIMLMGQMGMILSVSRYSYNVPGESELPQSPEKDGEGGKSEPEQPAEVRTTTEG